MSLESGIEMSDCTELTPQETQTANRGIMKTTEHESANKQWIVPMVVCLLCVVAAVALVGWCIYAAQTNKEDITNLKENINKLATQLEHIETVLISGAQPQVAPTTASLPTPAFVRPTQDIHDTQVESNNGETAILHGAITVEQRPIIAFSAYITSIMRFRTSGVVIPFASIITNSGEYYNTSTSKFTCHSEGVYAFFVSLHSDDGREAHASVVHENTTLAYLLADDEAGSGHDSHSSASVVVYCNTDEKVWVEINCPGYTCQLIGERYSTFSGFKIH